MSLANLQHLLINSSIRPLWQHQETSAQSGPKPMIDQPKWHIVKDGSGFYHAEVDGDVNALSRHEQRKFYKKFRRGLTLTVTLKSGRGRLNTRGNRPAKRKRINVGVNWINLGTNSKRLSGSRSNSKDRNWSSSERPKGRNANEKIPEAGNAKANGTARTAKAK